MVNNASAAAVPRLLQMVVRAYVVNVVVALGALVVLSMTLPRVATDDAWIHSLIVVVLAVVLVARLRTARAGRRSGLRAVGIICSALFVANVVLAVVPDVLPTWLRLDAVLVAVLMIAATGLVITTAVSDA